MNFRRVKVGEIFYNMASSPLSVNPFPLDPRLVREDEVQDFLFGKLTSAGMSA